MTFKRLLLLAPALMLALGANAFADVSVRFSSFGTVGYAVTDNPDVIITNPGQLKGANDDGTHIWNHFVRGQRTGSGGGSFLMDTRLGGQMNVGFTSDFSATVQVLAMQDARGVFTPRLEWAFLAYRPGDFSIRVGRLGWPAYFVSDYRYVGYAVPWVRAPLEVYKMAPIDYFDGADVSWSHSVGSGYLTIKVLGGHSSIDYPVKPALATDPSIRLRDNQLFGGYITYQIGGLTLRGGVSKTQASIDIGIQGMLAGMRGAGYIEEADGLNPQNMDTTFTSLGGKYDAHGWVVFSEYAKQTSGDVVGNSKAWYATVGHHFNAWTPYVTWAGFSTEDHTAKYASLPATPLPGPGPTQSFKGFAQGMTLGRGQHTLSLGVRWNASSGLDFKLQVDRVMPSSNAGNFSTSVTPAYDGSAFNMYTFVADFVF